MLYLNKIAGEGRGQRRSLKNSGGCEGELLKGSIVEDWVDVKTDYQTLILL